MQGWVPAAAGPEVLCTGASVPIARVCRAGCCEPLCAACGGREGRCLGCAAGSCCWPCCSAVLAGRWGRAGSDRRPSSRPSRPLGVLGFALCPAGIAERAAAYVCPASRPCPQRLRPVIHPAIAAAIRSRRDGRGGLASGAWASSSCISSGSLHLPSGQASARLPSRCWYSCQ